MQLKSIREMPDIEGKKVLVRVDHNVTMNPEGELKDDHKLRLSIPTLEYLIERRAKLITIMTHVGRPKGKTVEELRTAPIAKHLKELSPRLSGITYLENVRFNPGEEGNDPLYAKELAAHGEFFVDEAFPSLHTYEEASTCAVARLLPSYAGFHLMKEVEHLSQAIENPKRPLILLMSGAKMKTKIAVLKRFLDLADSILLGGCIANTFLAARGFDVGASKYEPEAMELAQELMLESEKEGKARILLPHDAVVATAATQEAEKIDLPLEDIGGDMQILDIGKVTVQRFTKEIERAATIIWNGPFGLYELNHFSHATKRIAEAVQAASKKGAFSIIGGGDTIDFHTRYKYPLDAYGFVSSGGGAMLEFLSATEPLPGLVPLMKG